MHQKLLSCFLTPACFYFVTQFLFSLCFYVFFLARKFSLKKQLALEPSITILLIFQLLTPLSVSSFIKLPFHLRKDYSPSRIVIKDVFFGVI